MELIVETSSDSGIIAVATIHRGETLRWETKPYIRTSKNSSVSEDGNVGSGDGIFGELNMYLATLPMAKQDIIWDAYKFIHELYVNDHCPVTSTSLVQEKVALIYEQMPYQPFEDWARGAGVIHFPRDIPSSHTGPEPEVTTYTQSDYFRMAALSIIERMMVPIWGEYMQRAVSGAMLPIRADLKEYYALLLMKNSSIMQCPPYLRLREYMAAILDRALKSEKSKSIVLQHLLSGLSPEAWPVWLTAHAMVRRNSMISLSPKTVNDGEVDYGAVPNIVADIYHYAKNKLVPRNKNGSAIIDKVPVYEDGAEEESVVEQYKNRQEIPDGEVRAANQSLSLFWRNAATALDPTLDHAMVEECIDATDYLKTEEILPASVVLIQWVLQPTMPMKMLGTPGRQEKPLLDNRALRCAAGLTQALLWHWRMPDLAALVTAQTDLRNGGSEFSTSGESRKSLTDEQVARLSEIYPNPMRVKGKANTIRHKNQGQVAIEAYCTLIQKSEWKLNCPKALLSQTPRIAGSRQMRTPANIRQRLADLLILLHQKRREFAERSYAREGAGEPIR